MHPVVAEAVAKYGAADLFVADRALLQRPEPLKAIEAACRSAQTIAVLDGVAEAVDGLANCMRRNDFQFSFARSRWFRRSWVFRRPPACSYQQV